MHGRSPAIRACSHRQLAHCHDRRTQRQLVCLCTQVSARPPWFLSLMYVEVFAQLPLFVVGVYAFATRKEWIRVPALVYSISTVATMVRAVRRAATDMYVPPSIMHSCSHRSRLCVCTHVTHCGIPGACHGQRRDLYRIAALGLESALQCLQVPILGELAMTPAKGGYNRSAVLACYLPFLVMPLVLAVRLLTAGPQLFPRPSRPRYKNR